MTTHMIDKVLTNWTTEVGSLMIQLLEKIHERNKKNSFSFKENQTVFICWHTICFSSLCNELGNNEEKLVWDWSASWAVSKSNLIDYTGKQNRRGALFDPWSTHSNSKVQTLFNSPGLSFPKRQLSRQFQIKFNLFLPIRFLWFSW